MYSTRLTSLKAFGSGASAYVIAFKGSLPEWTIFRDRHALVKSSGAAILVGSVGRIER